MIAAVIVCLTALGVSLLTLFSGFGLGTLLMPAFALFFPVEVAVASTAVVHAAHNLFKVGLLGREASRDIVIRFGIPAVFASFGGALDLGKRLLPRVTVPALHLVLGVLLLVVGCALAAGIA